MKKNPQFTLAQAQLAALDATVARMPRLTTSVIRHSDLNALRKMVRELFEQIPSRPGYCSPLEGALIPSQTFEKVANYHADAYRLSSPLQSPLCLVWGPVAWGLALNARRWAIHNYEEWAKQGGGYAQQKLSSVTGLTEGHAYQSFTDSRKGFPTFRNPLPIIRIVGTGCPEIESHFLVKDGLMFDTPIPFPESKIGHEYWSVYIAHFIKAWKKAGISVIDDEPLEGMGVTPNVLQRSGGTRSPLIEQLKAQVRGELNASREVEEEPSATHTVASNSLTRAEHEELKAQMEGISLQIQAIRESLKVLDTLPELVGNEFTKRGL